jgi:hypothetical protein
MHEMVIRFIHTCYMVTQVKLDCRYNEVWEIFDEGLFHE